MQKLKIIGVDVFLEKRISRLHVGSLTRETGPRDKKKLVFTYDEQYFGAKNVIPFGPEFPLTQRQFKSDRLFPSFEDRIPSTQNPAYVEYCQAMGIDPSEKDPMILLSTIGKKGPSSFIFYPVFERDLSVKDVIDFRKYLDLTTREFAQVFEISQSSLNALERNRVSGKDLLKRLELILKFPEVALYLLTINGGILTHDKLAKATQLMKQRKNQLNKE